MATPPLDLSAALPSAATASASVKAALPALTVMVMNGAINLLIAVLILVAGWMVARWVGRWAHDGLSRSHFIDETLKPLISNFVRYAILAITIVAVLSQFGVQTTSLIAVLGATGLAIGLALQGTLSNVASGVMLLFLRPFQVGEKIICSDTTGTVVEIGLFRTVIDTDEGVFVSVPNATLFSGTITNLSRETTRRTNFTVQVDRNEDLARVRDTLLAAVKADKRVQANPEPTVEVEKLEGATNTLSVQVWLQNRNFGGQRSDIRILVNQALLDAGIKPPLPYAAVPLPPGFALRDAPGGGTESSGTNKSPANSQEGSTR